jgi:hypothetical protein
MPTQTYIPGTEPPAAVRDPEIEQAIDDKAARVSAQKLAREAVQISDAKLMELIEARGTPYPFLERGTGRPLVLRVDAQRRLKATRAKSAKKEQADREFAEARGEAQDASSVVGGRRRGRKPENASESTTTPKTGKVDPDVRDAWESEVERRRGQSSEDAARQELDDPFAGVRTAMDTDDLDVVDKGTEHDTTTSDTPAQAAVREASEARAARRRGAR